MLQSCSPQPYVRDSLIPSPFLPQILLYSGLPRFSNSLSFHVEGNWPDVCRLVALWTQRRSVSAGRCLQEHICRVWCLRIMSQDHVCRTVSQDYVCRTVSTYKIMSAGRCLRTMSVEQCPRTMSAGQCIQDNVCSLYRTVSAGRCLRTMSAGLGVQDGVPRHCL